MNFNLENKMKKFIEVGDLVRNDAGNVGIVAMDDKCYVFMDLTTSSINSVRHGTIANLRTYCNLELLAKAKDINLTIKGDN